MIIQDGEQTILPWGNVKVWVMCRIMKGNFVRKETKTWQSLSEWLVAGVNSKFSRLDRLCMRDRCPVLVGQIIEI